MRAFIAAMFLISSLKLSAQTRLAKEYHDYLGNYLTIHSDSTFSYSQHIDLSITWTKGKWQFKKDTLYLRTIPVYDTVGVAARPNSIGDSLILSIDNNSQRLTNLEFIAALLSSGRQDPKICPEKLFLKKGRLYTIYKSRLVTKKQKGFWTIKEFSPWFIPTESK